MENPCILIPELNRIVFGAESWWSKIDESEISNISEISDSCISNQWYIKLLKEMINNEGE